MITSPCMISRNGNFIVALRRGNVYTRLEPGMSAAKIRYTGPAEDWHAGTEEPVLSRHQGESGEWISLRRLVNPGKVIFVFPERSTEESNFHGG